MRNHLQNLKGTVGRYRKILGVPAPLILVLFLLAETFKELVFDVFPSTLTHLALLAVLGLAAVSLARRLTRQVSVNEDPLIGAVGNVKLAHRKAMVLLVGLESAAPDSAAVKALAHARELQHLVLVGTPETQEKGVERKIIDQILPALNRTILEKNLVVRQRDSQAIQGTEEIVAAELTRLIHGVGLKRSEIVVDVSAGRQEGVAGAQEAAHRHRRADEGHDASVPGNVIEVEVQMVSGQWDEVARKTVPGTSSVKIVKEFYDDGLRETADLSGPEPLF